MAIFSKKPDYRILIDGHGMYHVEQYSIGRGWESWTSQVFYTHDEAVAAINNAVKNLSRSVVSVVYTD